MSKTEEKTIECAFKQTFLLKGPGGFMHTVQFDSYQMSDEDRARRDLLFKSHLDGTTIDITKRDEDDGGPKIKGVIVAKVHSEMYVVGQDDAEEKPDG